MVSDKKLLAISKEEAKTAKEYKAWGYPSQARDEARHSKFFKAQAMGKGFYGHSLEHSVNRTKGYSTPKSYGWDRNHAIYRKTMRGERVRGLVIKNPKPISVSKAKELRVN